jgi:hypothetical protein
MGIGCLGLHGLAAVGEMDVVHGFTAVVELASSV